MQTRRVEALGSVVLETAKDVAAVPLFSSLNQDQLQELANWRNWFHVQKVGEGLRLIGDGASATRSSSA